MKTVGKKVVLVIVEGKSDEAAFGTIFKEYFQDSHTHFHVVNGDITTADYVEPDKIIQKIAAILERLELRYGFSYKGEESDYLRIIHITDTDGVFVPDSFVQEKEECKQDRKVLYYTDHIESHSRKSTIDRNHRKAKILIKLSKENTICKIPYRIYYNSCNLEHVLFGILEDLSDDKKMEMADDFAERYEGDIESFIGFISDGSIAVQGDFKKTWQYIYKSKSCNSLERHTNLNLIFE